ncbi:Protein Y38F1A.8 [Aphelenchoides avenae]|nr:Protein Y38F1A.8 [Aphelenchus avenae]
MEETESCKSLTSAKNSTCNGDIIGMSSLACAWPKKPECRFKIRTLCLLGALLPGIGCYLCIAYTYLFQIDRVLNFTSTNCPDVKSTFPPVSYSIGVWKPQKFFWLLVLSAHLPPRLFFGVIYKNLYRLGHSEYSQERWFQNMVKYSPRILVVEAIGLVTVSIIDIETYFGIHAVCYAVWIIAFDFNMMFNCVLHHYAGVRKLSPMHEKVFYVKCATFLIAYPLSWSTGISYGIYVLKCSGLAYALFSVAEYILVGCNSLFYFLLFLEVMDSRVEFHVKHEDELVVQKASTPSTPSV